MEEIRALLQSRVDTTLDQQLIFDLLELIKEYGNERVWETY